MIVSKPDKQRRLSLLLETAPTGVFAGVRGSIEVLSADPGLALGPGRALKGPRGDNGASPAPWPVRVNVPEPGCHGTRGVSAGAPSLLWDTQKKEPDRETLPVTWTRSPVEGKQPSTGFTPVAGGRPRGGGNGILLHGDPNRPGPCRPAQRAWAHPAATQSVHVHARVCTARLAWNRFHAQPCDRLRRSSPEPCGPLAAVSGHHHLPFLPVASPGLRRSPVCVSGPDSSRCFMGLESFRACPLGLAGALGTVSSGITGAAAGDRIFPC